MLTSGRLVARRTVVMEVEVKARKLLELMPFLQVEYECVIDNIRSTVIVPPVLTQ